MGCVKRRERNERQSKYQLLWDASAYKKLEQCGFTKQELQRIAERLKTETGADLIVTQGGKAA